MGIVQNRVCNLYHRYVAIDKRDQTECRYHASGQQSQSIQPIKVRFLLLFLVYGISSSGSIIGRGYLFTHSEQRETITMDTKV